MLLVPFLTCSEILRMGERHFITRTMSSEQNGPGAGIIGHLWRHPGLEDKSRSDFPPSVELHLTVSKAAQIVSVPSMSSTILMMCCCLLIFLRYVLL